MTFTIPVAEIFGPTIQGEGALAGVPSHFIRLGGCEYRCKWCDSDHAVLPKLVKKLPRMTPQEIMTEVASLPYTKWITLSGGNPVLHDLGPLVRDLQARGHKIAVETQGTVFPEWLDQVDLITVSPKPPSAFANSLAQLAEGALDHLPNPQQHLDFMLMAKKPSLSYYLNVKIVIFNEQDLEWAFKYADIFGLEFLYLSLGTNIPGEGTEGDTPLELHSRYQWLCEAVLERFPLPKTLEISVLPQLHVVAWGHKLGV